MKKLMLLVSSIMILAGSSLPSMAATLYFEDFNTTNGGYTSGGGNNEWEWDLNKGFWGTDLDGHYENNSNQWLRSKTLDLGADPSIPVTLFFDFFLDTEKNYDYVYVEYSSDNGNSWNSLNFHPNTGYQDWQTYSTDISGFAGSSFNLQWRLTSDCSVRKDGLYIDNVKIEGEFAAIPEPATMVLVGLGLLGLAGIQRRKGSRKGNR